MLRKLRPYVRFQPKAEGLEERKLLSEADGNGPVVTNLVATSNRTIVVSFDGPMNASLAQSVGEYQVNGLTSSNPEFITKSGPVDRILNATYNATSQQVTLTLAKPLKAATFYRVFINGTPGSGLTDVSGTLFDGDNDDTPGGNFYGLVAAGPKIKFTDALGNAATLRLFGPGTLSLWRELNGNVDVLSILGSATGQTTLTGSIQAAKGTNGLVAIPLYQGLAGVNNWLPPTFVRQLPPVTSPTPVVANSSNLPYTLQITKVTLPSAPAIQSAVYAQSNGYWLVFGGRTNGLHNFDPSGLVNFPPVYQNNNIYVIKPKTGQTWTEAWSATGLPSAMTASLSSSNQEYFQKGNRLYTIGGYSFNDQASQFTTYSTLSALGVNQMINTVIAGGSLGSQVKQIQNPRLQVTGGDLGMIGNRTYLMFGQNFQGGYNGGGASISQVYTNEIRSFNIIDSGSKLGISGFQAQRDPGNFRRRDGNLAVPTILPNGQQGITAFGGVFTAPAGSVFRQPIVVNSSGMARVDYNYQQYFTQYDSAKVALYDAKSKSMSTLLFGGISLYDYNFATGTLSSDPEIPFVNDVTSLVQQKNGTTQEYIMPSQLPGLYGAEAAFYATPGLPSYANGVLKLNNLRSGTVLGDIYGGVYSTVGDTTNPATQTTASNQVFQVTLLKY